MSNRTAMIAPSSMTPSLKDIAADLSVSHALVSRVLNNRMGTTRVSKRVREAIVQRAKELNYQPNPLALALKRGRKGAVGVFIHGIGVEGSEIVLDFIQAAGKSLSDLGLNLWLQFFREDEEFLNACDGSLLRKIDGLIVAGLSHYTLQDRLADIEKSGLHVVSACHGVEEDSPAIRVTNYQVDFVQQGVLVTEHLLSLGCRKIAELHNSLRRGRGFEQAHEVAGVPVDPRLRVQLRSYTAEAGYQGMKTLLTQGFHFDGLVAHSDAMASGAMRCLLDYGWPVERWPKITGVDDSPIAREYCHIPVTSVTAEMKATAEYAVSALFQKIEGEPPVIVKIQPRLMVRQSTAV